MAGAGGSDYGTRHESEPPMNAAFVIYGAGPRDEVALDPTAIAFHAQRADSCRGCIFEGQWSEVCKKAAVESVARGGADCDAGYIYVAVEVDPRQLTLESGHVPAATGTALTKPKDLTREN